MCVSCMQLAGIMYPPGAAFCFLYVTEASAQVLGYWFIVSATAGSTIVFLVALVVNNAVDLKNRRYPGSWIG